MMINLKIFRYNPETRTAGKLVDYAAEISPGMSVLAVLHKIHDEQDGTLSYRYSCRGAICGTCAIMINGKARLACKTQIADIIEEAETITLEPLANMKVIKDLVVDKRPFWQAISETHPWLIRKTEMPDERITYESLLSKSELDELNRASDCIKCASCFADCPKIAEAADFIGPAISIQIYKQLFDPRDTNTNERLGYSAAPTGVSACDKHANCVKACPKDCRPLRAITFIKNKITLTT
ncbi:4Fe-4S dicluster domain-containing protein [candidate division KSB1 bacterium]|nr:4Fe-4S dicluster domain-containing protein [candidate division KSB1 bacterium]